MRVSTTRFLSLLLASSLGCAAVIGCENKSNPLAPPAEKLEASSSESANAEVWKIERDGEAKFTMVGKVETIVGELTTTRGKLEIDLKDLTRTRGAVEMDLLTLETMTFEDKAKNKKQTADALTWLEVSERPGNEESRKKHQWAVFAIRSIDKAVPANIAALSGDTRSAQITATGDLLLHGRKTSLTVELQAEFDFSGGTPQRLEIETKEPMVVNLAAHDVRPRDSVGKLITTLSEALKVKLADDATITFDLDASPTGKKMNLPPAPPRQVAPAPSHAPSHAPGNAPGAPQPAQKPATPQP